MFGLSRAKPPIREEQQQWVDASFVRLAKLLGAQRLLGARVMLPTEEHFPDRYDEDEGGLQAIFRRVAEAMHVKADEIEVTLFAMGDEITKGFTPFYQGRTSGAAGLYHHNPEEKAHISVNEKELKNPIALVASLAHEIGHVILLRPEFVGREEPEMEPLNDLLTVFLGFGVFTANAAFRFEQHQDYQSQGWSAQRQGYLSEETFGYALARFAYERRERKPEWAKFLSTNVRVYQKRAQRWLEEREQPRLFG